MRPNDFVAGGIESLLKHLREGPLGKTPIPDAYHKIRNYDQVVCRPGEVIGEFVIREDNLFRDMRSALKRLRSVRLRREAAQASARTGRTATSTVKEPTTEEFEEAAEIEEDAEAADATEKKSVISAKSGVSVARSETDASFFEAELR
eukprot:6994173-Pyramimonas_sp.AAC.1